MPLRRCASAGAGSTDSTGSTGSSEIEESDEVVFIKRVDPKANVKAVGTADARAEVKEQPKHRSSAPPEAGAAPSHIQDCVCLHSPPKVPFTCKNCGRKRQPGKSPSSGGGAAQRGGGAPARALRPQEAQREVEFDGLCHAVKLDAEKPENRFENLTKMLLAARFGAGRGRSTLSKCLSVTLGVAHARDKGLVSARHSGSDNWAYLEKYAKTPHSKRLSFE